MMVNIAKMTQIIFGIDMKNAIFILALLSVSCTRSMICAQKHRAVDIACKHQTSDICLKNHQQLYHRCVKQD
jgi:hypothetical protein